MPPTIITLGEFAFWCEVVVSCFHSANTYTSPHRCKPTFRTVYTYTLKQAGIKFFFFPFLSFRPLLNNSLPPWEWSQTSPRYLPIERSSLGGSCPLSSLRWNSINAGRRAFFADVFTRPPKILLLSSDLAAMPGERGGGILPALTTDDRDRSRLSDVACRYLDTCGFISILALLY